MAKYAVIENNKVINLIEADENFAEVYDKEIVLTEGNVGIGSDYINGKFSYTKPPISESQAKEWRAMQLEITDFIAQTPDYPNRDAWITYRQELRDWPSTAGFPETKPTKPE